MDEWVQQQQQQQRRGAWAVRALSAKAATRDLRARLSRANEDTRDAETQLAAVTRERERLASRVKAVERDLGTRVRPRGAIHRHRQGRVPRVPRAQRPRGWGGGGEHSCWCSLPLGWRAGMPCQG